MNQTCNKPPSALCKYKSILVDLDQDPIPLPGLELFKKNYRFTSLLKKINKLNDALTDRKSLNRIYLTPSGTAENSYKESSVYYTTWRGLANENREYKESMKKIELQNYRISRLKRIRRIKNN